MTRKEAILKELLEAPPRTNLSPPPRPGVHVPVLIRWPLDDHHGLVTLKAMLFQSTDDFHQRWSQAELPSGLIVGVFRSVDTGLRTVRLTVPLQMSDQQRQDALRLRDLWELKGWGLSKEVAGTERRSTYLEPAP